MTSINDSSHLGDESQGRVSEGHRLDASHELAATLRSLDETMKQHLIALDRRKEIVNSLTRLQQQPPTPKPQLAVPAPAGGQRPSVISVADLPRAEKVHHAVCNSHTYHFR